MIRAGAIFIAMVALTLAACSDQQAIEDPLISDQVPVSETGVFSILNAGVRAQLGAKDAAVKLLFDPLYDDHFGTLEPLDDALIERIISGAAPYDNVTVVFVSHAHGDHFSASMFNRMLAAQPDLMLVAPRQAIEDMRQGEGWQPDFAARITEISLENGEAADSFEIAGAQIEAFRSPHTGWPDRHAHVHNITYRVSMGTGDDRYHRIMHFGDADPARSHYSAHSEFFSSARTGLAIVPYWHFGTANPDTLFDATFNADQAVGMHVPVTPPQWLSKTGRTYFTGEGQFVGVAKTP